MIASVDTGICSFLFALGMAHDFKKDVAIVVNGKNILELTDGLHGESYGKEGWNAKYSKYGNDSEKAP